MIDHPPTIIIQDDRGGLIGDYLNQVRKAKQINAFVEVRGKCFSACTLWASMPRDQICVGPDAMLGFHSTSLPTIDGVLRAYYPETINTWLDHRGGLNNNIKFLAGDALHAMFPACK